MPLSNVWKLGKAGSQERGPTQRRALVDADQCDNARPRTRCETASESVEPANTGERIPGERGRRHLPARPRRPRLILGPNGKGTR